MVFQCSRIGRFSVVGWVGRIDRRRVRFRSICRIIWVTMVSKVSRVGKISRSRIRRVSRVSEVRKLG
jgi:hypothetical protein